MSKIKQQFQENIPKLTDTFLYPTRKSNYQHCAKQITLQHITKLLKQYPLS